ncbi:MAG: flippase-like domain-containing protein [Thermoanaerobaculia bacterium]|nr:flippase-like domain-containing protein [Thermoanaerobaculia bacterium]
MEPATDNAARLPPSKIIRRGIQGFIFFSAIGTVVSMWWKRPAGLAEMLEVIDWRFMALLIPLIALDYWLGGFRYRLYFDGKIFPNVSLWDCMRSNWANMFMGAATPFQTGGGPAQIYVLWRKGVSVTDSILVSVMNFSATLVFFILSSIAVLAWIPPGFLGADFTPVFQTAFIVVGSIAGLMLLLLFFPYIGHFLINRIAMFIPLRGEKTLSKRDRLLLKLEQEIERFGSGFRSVVQRAKWKLLVTVVATIVLFSGKYVMGYVVARAMGQDVPFDLFFGLQIVQLLMIYFAPTPGASGVAEISAAWLMGTLIPAELLLVYVVLWRFSTTIFGAVIGGFVLLRELGEDRQQPAVAPVE